MVLALMIIIVMVVSVNMAYAYLVLTNIQVITVIFLQDLDLLGALTTLIVVNMDPVEMEDVYVPIHILVIIVAFHLVLVLDVLLMVTVITMVLVLTKYVYAKMDGLDNGVPYHHQDHRLVVLIMHTVEKTDHV
jgi:hypothetical protein